MTASPRIDWPQLLEQASQPLQAQAQQRLPLQLNAATVGSVCAEDAALLAGCHPAMRCSPTQCTILGDFATASAALQAMALALKQAGKLKAWRNELLPVGALPTAGQPLTFDSPLAQVERAAARRLGVLTHAVHLLGFASDTQPGGEKTAAMWLQERAANKATDPGLWDTLAGGLVAAGDSLHSGLLRETYEEAGLAPEQLLDLRSYGALLVQKTVPEGMMIELAWTYSATLVRGAEPRNLDGEVESFARLAANEVRSLIADGQLTLEAALAIGVVWGEIRTRNDAASTGRAHA